MNSFLYKILLITQKYFIYLIFWDVIWTEQSLEVWICFFIFCCFGLFFFWFVFFRNCSLLCQGASLQHLWGKSFGLCCGFIGAWCRNSLTFSKWSLFKITVTAATLKYRKKNPAFFLNRQSERTTPSRTAFVWAPIWWQSSRNSETSMRSSVMSVEKACRSVWKWSETRCCDPCAHMFIQYIFALCLPGGVGQHCPS